jgi:hypothetical protein
MEVPKLAARTAADTAKVKYLVNYFLYLKRARTTSSTWANFEDFRDRQGHPMLLLAETPIPTRGLHQRWSLISFHFALLSRLNHKCWLSSQSPFSEE